MRKNKWRNRSVGQQECVGDKKIMPAFSRAGINLIVETSTITGELHPWKDHSFCFAQPHSSD